MSEFDRVLEIMQAMRAYLVDLSERRGVQMISELIAIMEDEERRFKAEFCGKPTGRG